MDVNELLARESIRQTMSNYTIAGDRLRTDDFVAVFTDDGILESEGVPTADLFRYEGRQQLRQWLDRWRVPATEPVHRSKFIRHHLSTSQIELTGSASARARTYWVAYTDIGPDHCGYYLDEFRKVGERWLIAHRRVRLDWRLEKSLYMSAINNTRPGE